MAIKHSINKLVAGGEAGGRMIKSRKLMAILGILWLWSFCGAAFIFVAQAQNAANLAIDSPGSAVNGNIVNFHTTSGLNDADWRYWWVVRGPRNQWTFAGPSGNLDLPPGNYRATVTARDRYGDTAYQDTSTFLVESPTATSTTGRRSAGNVNYQDDGRTYGRQTYNDGLYDRYGSGNDYYDRYGDGFQGGDNYYSNGEGYNGGYGDGYYGDSYNNRYDGSPYYGAYGRAYDDRYDNMPYGDRYGGEYNENFDGGYGNGYGGYDKVKCGTYNGYDDGYGSAVYGSEYNDGGYYQDGSDYDSGQYGDENLDNYNEGGEYGY